MLDQLSPQQQSLWFAQAAEPGSARFQCAELVFFSAPVDFSVLAETIRHCLRQLPQFAAFLGENPADIPIVVKRLACADDDDVQQWAQQEISIPVHLTHGAFTAAELSGHHLIELSDGRQVWLARFHHILGDGFAFHALLKWIAACYSARLAGAPAPESPFISDQHTTQVPTPAPADRDFWADYPITAAPPALLSESPGSITSTELVTVRAEVPTGIRRKVQQLATDAGVSEVSVLTAVIGHYTAVMTDAKQVWLGLPCANRPLGQSKIAQEPLVDVVPFVVSAAGPLELDEEIRRHHEHMTAVRAHASCRSEEIRRMHRVSPSDRIVGPTVNFRPFSPSLSLAGSSAQIRTVSVGAVGDVEFLFQSEAGGFAVQAFAYGTTSAALDLHLRRITHLLSCVADGARSLTELPCALPEEVELVVRQFNNTDHPLPCDTLFEMVSRQRARDAADPEAKERVGLRFGEESLTRAQMWRHVDQLREWLLTQGLSPERPVALHLRRSPALQLAVAAAVLAGTSWVPIDPELPRERKQYMLAQSGAAAVLTCAELDIPAPGPVLRVREDTVNPLDLEQVSQRTAVAPNPRQCAYVLFTSGSTGRPKAVAVPQDGIANRLEWMTHWYGIGPHDVVAQKTPSSFDVSVWELLLPFTHGVTAAIARPGIHKDPAQLQAFLQATGATVCHFVPSALTVFLSGCTPSLPQLRMVITSGEALDAALASRTMQLLDVKVHNLYGPTEAAIDVSAHTCAMDEPRTPIGVPVWNTRLYVLDRWGNPVPVGCPGRLYLSGPQVALGYLGQPELTAERFDRDPFWPASPARYDSGDMACWTTEGELLYLGRKDAQVKLRGQRLELGEVESVLTQCPGVAHAAAKVVQAPSGAELLVAYVVGPVTAVHVLDFAREQLPDFMIPARVTVLERLPITVNGKLDRAALPTPSFVISGDASDSADVRRMRSCFAKVLGIPDVTAEANFFELGGTSLNAVELVSEVNTRFPGAELGIADVFAAHSPVQLAARLRADAGPRSFDTIFPLREHTSGTPIFCFYPAGGLSWSYARLLPLLHDAKRGVFALQSPLLASPPLDVTSLREAAGIAVRDIVRVTREQEVDLIGWSIGGVLAHEVAYQLREHHGIHARTLCLLDAYPAESWRRLPAPSLQDQLRGIATMAGQRIPHDAVLDESHVLRLLRTSKGPFSHLPADIIESLMRTIRKNAAFMREHSTADAQLEATLFVATQEESHRELELNPQAWRSGVATLRIKELPVDHPGMMNPQALAAVAEVINARP